jgi:hypothetical protein
MEMDSIKDTPYIEECCRALNESKQYPSDKHLVHLVQLQQISEKIRPISLPADGVDQPLAMYIKMLHTELQQFEDSMPSELRQDSM